MDLSEFYMGKPPDCQFLNLTMLDTNKGIIGVNFAYAPSNPVTDSIMNKVKVGAFRQKNKYFSLKERYNIANMLDDPAVDVFLKSLNINNFNASIQCTSAINGGLFVFCLSA